MAANREKAKRLVFADRESWRSWLLENHVSESEAWLVFNKRHTGREGVQYDEAVEEALCFGWIDSVIKKIDDDKYMHKFTPRKKKSEWSELNKKRARKMLREGKMAEPGLQRIKEAKADGRWGKVKFRESPVRIPLDLRLALKENSEARDFFDSLAPSYKKLAIGWILAARKDETRQRRIAEVVELSARKKKLGMK